jgi:hypothetical protein
MNTRRSVKSLLENIAQHVPLGELRVWPLLERPRIGHTLILFETADLRIAVPNLNGELTLGEFLTFAQVFEKRAKGREFFPVKRQVRPRSSSLGKSCK